ncbi:8036_t:CDS:1, partial [Funneliformis caledonium]
IKKSRYISGENVVSSYEQITENDREEKERSSNYNNSYISSFRKEMLRITFLGFQFIKDWTNKRRKNIGIYDRKTSSERKSKSNEDNVFKCQN